MACLLFDTSLDHHPYLSACMFYLVPLTCDNSHRQWPFYAYWVAGGNAMERIYRSVVTPLACLTALQMEVRTVVKFCAGFKIRNLPILQVYSSLLDTISLSSYCCHQSSCANWEKEVHYFIHFRLFFMIKWRKHKTAETTEMRVISAHSIDWPNRSYHIIIRPQWVHFSEFWVLLSKL